MLSNYASEADLVRHLKYEYKVNNLSPDFIVFPETGLPPWNIPFFEEFADFYPYREAWQHYSNIVGNLTNDPTLQMSALDIAPILTSAKSYLTGKRGSQQFRFTVAQHMWKTEPEKFETSKMYIEEGNITTVAAFPDNPPSFLNRHNYFGELMTPHLLVVMEVMHHCILRAAPLRENWMHHSMYEGKWSQLLPFAYNLNSQQFHLKMSDYIKKDSLSYMPIHGLARFEEEWKINNDSKSPFAPISFNYDRAEILNSSFTLTQLQSSSLKAS